MQIPPIGCLASGLKVIRPVSSIDTPGTVPDAQYQELVEPTKLKLVSELPGHPCWSTDGHDAFTPLTAAVTNRRNFQFMLNVCIYCLNGSRFYY